MTHPDKHKDPSHGGRRDRMIHEMEHDPYRSRVKPTEPAACPECGAVFHQGRWQWAQAAPNAHEVLCPACARIRDGVPAGYVTLRGTFLGEHAREILQLARNHEERARNEHPLQRIMDVEQEPTTIHITCTDQHLARGIGEAVRHAYAGELELQYTDEDQTVRVTWHRDD
jgi:NMD protein affecting ribosome stability and mRNA decay